MLTKEHCSRFNRQGHSRVNVPLAAELAKRFESGQPATTNPAGVNPAVAALQANSGWRQPGAVGENVSPALAAMREHGCDSRIDVRSKLSWAEFRDEYVRQVRCAPNSIRVAGTASPVGSSSVPVKQAPA